MCPCSSQTTELSFKQSCRYTSFLGAFAGVYVAVDEGIAAMFGNKKWGASSPLLLPVWAREQADACGLALPSTEHCAHRDRFCRTSKWRAAVAGGAAAPTILLTGRALPCRPAQLACDGACRRILLRRPLRTCRCLVSQDCVHTVCTGGRRDTPAWHCMSSSGASRCSCASATSLTRRRCCAGVPPALMLGLGSEVRHSGVKQTKRPSAPMSSIRMQQKWSCFAPAPGNPEL